MTPPRVKYLSCRQQRQLEINLDKYPSAGPHPNVTGMRNLYWGNDAFLVRQGKYVYKVSKKDYDKIR